MRTLAAVVMLMLSARPAAAAESEAAAKVAASFAALHRADALPEGWAPVYDEGARLAEEATALEPRNAGARYALFCNLGRKSDRSGVTAQLRTVGRLRALLDETLALDPNHGHAWEAKGEMLLRLPWLLGGSESSGEDALRRAAALEPSWPKPRLRLAELHRKRGDVAAARYEAEAARALALARRDEDARRRAEELLSGLPGR